MLLWLFAWSAIFLEQVLINTDPLKHWVSIVTNVFSPLMLIILVPLGLLGRRIGNLKPFRPYRWWISLALPFALCCWPVLSAARQRIDPAVGFRRYFDARLPENARDLRMDIYWIFTSDVTAVYSFQCQRQETERLIRELHLRDGDLISLSGAPVTSRGGLYTAIGSWKKPRGFRNNSGNTFFELWTDETFTRVVMHKTHS